MNPEDDSSYQLYEVDLPTVEFEIEHFPAPLQWDARERVVRWARPPLLEGEALLKWNAVLTEIQQLIGQRTSEHWDGHPVSRALQTRDHPKNPRLMYHIKSLKEIFPPSLLAKPVVVSEPKVVKHHIIRYRLPPGWNF